MKKELWLRLKHYHFDDLVPAHLKDQVRAMFSREDASTQAFAAKLARKLGWSHAFALRAIEEYRKFIFLGLVSELPVTPPKVIDQVWHEHLLFSRGYREFCRTVLRRDFDHHPELVPTDDQTATFQAQYIATLHRYREEFRVAPPAVIWGTPKFSVNDDALLKERLKTGARDDAKRKVADRGPSPDIDSLPLFMYFDNAGGGSGDSWQSMPEFSGGGGFSGAGGGSSWGDSHGSGHGADSSSSGDSGGSSDGGGGDGGGGSGCSSGCGGGGCGGG